MFHFTPVIGCVGMGYDKMGYNDTHMTPPLHVVSVSCVVHCEPIVSSGSVTQHIQWFKQLVKLGHKSN